MKKGRAVMAIPDGESYDSMRDERNRLRVRVEELEARLAAALAAARIFAARINERCPSWFQEEKGSTDFSDADHVLRAVLNDSDNSRTLMAKRTDALPTQPTCCTCRELGWLKDRMV